MKIAGAGGCLTAPYDNDRSAEETMQSYLDRDDTLLEKLEADGAVAL